MHVAHAGAMNSCHAIVFLATSIVYFVCTFDSMYVGASALMENIKTATEDADHIVPVLLARE